MNVQVTYQSHPDPDCVIVRVTVNGVARETVARNAAARAALAKANKLGSR